jgi:uncharacterized protein (TIGR02646 family)
MGCRPPVCGAFAARWGGGRVIRIEKPVRPPAILADAGVARRRAHSREFTAQGMRHFVFDRSIYAHDSVKQALLAVQYGKCCFCESKVRHIASGDIEHFRPKAAVRQTVDGPLEVPGYYWLAYDWTNLYFCCERCNRRQKANLFPLLDPSKRVRTHSRARDVRKEQPLFIDPGKEEPEHFIGFRRHAVYPIDDDARAKQTIAALGLDRPELDERRRSMLAPLMVSVDVLLTARLDPSIPKELIAKAAEVLADRTEDSGEYSAAVRCMLRAELGEDCLRFPLTQGDFVAYAAGRGLPRH